MNQMKAERKGKTPYTKKINMYVPSASCIHNTYAYGDPLDQLKIFRCKDCVEKFIGHIEDEVSIFTWTNDRADLCVQKNEVEAGSRKNIISALKILMTLRTES